VYAYYLIRRNMLPRKTKSLSTKAITAEAIAVAKKTKEQGRSVIKSILGANLSMITKQGSLLFGWAYATARATRLGASQVAAHQVALSVWLVFALILDGTAVSAQVLMSRAYTQRDRPKVQSLTKYMIGMAFVQGLISLLVVDGINVLVPRLFTPDPAIQAHLHRIMPHLAWQQVLVSLTLVIESLAAGANQFGILATGTAISTLVALWQISRQASVDGIWFLGIGTLFVGRLATACVAMIRALWTLRKEDRQRLPVDS
jgi:Na+-driven multidrug efflux pump